MPCPCTICSHPRRDEIDRTIIEGGTLRSVAHAFAVSPHALGRHARRHLPARLAGASAVPAAPPEPTTIGVVEEPLAAFFRARRITELAATASLRDHALRDLERLEAVLAAAVAANNVPAILATLRTKWFLADRAGLTEKPDAPLHTAAIAPPSPQIAVMAEQFLRLLQSGRENTVAAGTGAIIPNGSTEPDAGAHSS